MDDTGTLRLNEKHVKEKLGNKNSPVITSKYGHVSKSTDMN